MIISLPVKQYNKYIKIPFNIVINNDLITVSPLISQLISKESECKIYHIILYSESFGINTIPIIFPQYFNIINKELLSDHFYIFQALSSNNNIDFLGILLNELKYKLYNNTNINNLINVLKLNNDNSHIVNDNTESVINKNYNRISKYINFCLAILLDSKLNISQTSKITHIINFIKQLKVEFFGNTFTVEEHIEHINNHKLIKKKRFYFYEKNNKTLKVFVNDNNKENLSAYPLKYKKHINIKNLINILIINYFDKLFEIGCKVLFKKYPNIINLMISFINIKQPTGLVSNDSIILYETTDNNIHKLSFDNFKNTIDNDSNYENYNETLFNELINDYTYPINYDKRTINQTFAKILYYYLKFNVNIKPISNLKIKILLHNIYKIYKSLQGDTINCLNNYKIYNDYLLFSIFKILFYNDTYNLFIKTDSIKNKFTNNIIILQIINSLSWSSISKDLSLLKYIISIKDICGDLIVSDGKINKCYNIDNRIKKIILEPIYMLNYLKREEDFLKCIVNFKNHINKIFNNMIQLDNNDYSTLSKILYSYSKIKEQNNNDVFYKKLIKYGKMNSKIIIFNDRINIKLKDIFKNININLGFLARDITNEEAISISEDTDNINEYTETINKLKRKYYKYKGKYLEMKSTTEINTDNFY